MIRALLSLLPAESRRDVTSFVALTVLGVAVRAVGVVLLVPLLTALFGAEPARAWPWVGALVLATAVGWLLDAAAARRAFDLGFTLLAHGQRGVAQRLARVRLDWFTGTNVAAAREAIAATGPELVGLVVYLITPVVSSVLLPTAIGVALLFVSWPLGLAALAGVPLLLGTLWASNRLSRAADHAAAEANSRLTERIVEFARTQAELRAARRVEPARSHAGAALAAQHAATVRLLTLTLPGELLFGLVSQVALVLLAGTAAWLALTGRLGAPAAVALIVVIARYLESITVLAALAPGLEPTMETLRRIRRVLTAPTVGGPSSARTGGDAGGHAGATVAAPAESAGLGRSGGPSVPAVPAVPAEPGRVGAVGASSAAAPGSEPRAARVTFEDVTFAYTPDGPPVLDGLDLVLEPGSTTAIVGPSGSGKSTILTLVAGLREPSSGRIRVEAGGVAGAPDPAWASVVFQHPYLFSGSIRANVLAGDADASPEAFAQAVALARVDELAARLPDGLDSAVGEGGVALSGGERQRVSIARALLKPAPLLLVDEATSALDTENEAAIVAALAADVPGAPPRTRVIVAHRLASIAAADRVLFVEDGRIVEDGTVADLLAAGGRFARFWHHRRDAADWRLGAEREGATA